MTATAQNNEQSWTKQALKWFWMAIIPIVILVFIASKLEFSVIQDIIIHLRSEMLGYGLWCILLIPLNLGLEGLNWHLIVKKTSGNSYLQSLKIVLAGRSLNVIGPIGLGDAYIRFDQWRGTKVHSAGWILVERMIKMIPTLLFGVMATYYLIAQGKTELRPWIIWFLVGLMMAVVVVAAFFRRIRAWLFEKYAMLKGMPPVQMPVVLRIFIISLFRYLVYAAQFLLALKWVGITSTSLTLFMGVSWVFFVKSIVPNFTVLGDLTKREFASIFFFSWFAVNIEQVAAGSLLIWLINIIFPALIGLIALLDIKWRKA